MEGFELAGLEVFTFTFTAAPEAMEGFDLAGLEVMEAHGRPWKAMEALEAMDRFELAGLEAMEGWVAS